MDKSSLIPRDSRLLWLSDRIAVTLSLWLFAAFYAKTMLAVESREWSADFLIGMIAAAAFLMVSKPVLYFVASLLHSLSQPAATLPTFDAFATNVMRGWKAEFFSARSLQIIPSRA